MLLLLMAGKKFGMSSNLKTVCTICGAGNHTDFFKFNWKVDRWNLLVALGTIIGGFIAANFLSNSEVVSLNSDVIMELHSYGITSAGTSYLPTELFSNEALFSVKSIMILVVGGFLVGFGTRYAGGCTSGHAISGLSDFQLPSLIAVIGFFIGGLVMVHLLFPLIF